MENYYDWLFLIVCAAANDHWKVLKKARVSAALFSYPYLAGKTEDYISNLFSELKEVGTKLFLDSGAWTAYNKERKIPIVDLGHFLMKWGLSIWRAASLDVIRKSGPTRENMEYLVSEGIADHVTLINTHHQDETICNEDGTGVLIQMLEEHRKCIGISPEEYASPSSKKAYLFDCLPLLNGCCPPHVHIFGEGPTPLLKDFALALNPLIRLSSDSSTYLADAINHILILPDGGKVGVGTRGRSPIHTQRIPKCDQEGVGYLLKQAGMSWNDVIGEDSAKGGNRAYFNARSLMQYQARIEALRRAKLEDLFAAEGYDPSSEDSDSLEDQTQQDILQNDGTNDFFFDIDEPRLDPDGPSPEKSDGPSPEKSDGPSPEKSD